MTTIFRKDGETFSINLSKQRLRLTCCDCYLTHDFKIKIKGKIITLQAFRNTRSTNQFRKYRTDNRRKKCK